MILIDLSLIEAHLVVAALKERKLKAGSVFTSIGRNKSLDENIKEEIEELNTLIDMLEKKMYD